MADVHDDEFGEFQTGQPPLDVAMDKHARSNVPMTTSGLANCMAIVAFRPNSDDAVLWHLNTLAVFEADFETEAYNADGEPEQAWRLKRSAMEAAKKQVDTWLGHDEGVRYAIALGTQWRSGVAKPQRKAELVEAIREVFDPAQLLTSGQDVATWDPFTKHMT
jgi:hypothetical protein